MPKDIPSSILIIGSGVFGLGTAWALTKRPEFKNTKITLLERLDFPAPDAASIDSSRIVRPDYPDAAYSQLAAEAQKIWRGDFGAEGRYMEAGLCIVMDDTSDAEQGRKYMQGSLQNVKEKLGLKEGRREDGGQVTVLHDENDIKKVLKNMDGDLGKHGYVNWTSGWAQAEDTMKYLRHLVAATGRVDFQTGEAEHLLFSPDNTSVTGVQLTSPAAGQLTADLTILATGAWTPRLLDLRGIASANGQILAYLSLSQQEQESLGSNPTMLNESTGMFIIPPRNNVLKVARHGYGYANPSSIPHPEHPGSGERIEVSLPRTKVDDPNLSIPPEGLAACRSFLARCIPSLSSRPFTQTRICWYTDTVHSDFLVDYHPHYPNLFVATGGSGHAWKFLPVLGERVVEILLGGEASDELGRVLRGKWAWPRETDTEGVGRGDGHVFTADWRGGRRGMVLDQEMGRREGC